MLADRRTKLTRAANMMRGGEIRLRQRVFISWRDSLRADRENKNSKLMLFFMSREEWWMNHGAIPAPHPFLQMALALGVGARARARWLMCMHTHAVITTWRNGIRQEKRVRKFLTRWMHQGMAKCFIGWKRHVRIEVDERCECSYRT